MAKAQRLCSHAILPPFPKQALFVSYLLASAHSFSHKSIQEALVYSCQLLSKPRFPFHWEWDQWKRWIMSLGLPVMDCGIFVSPWNFYVEASFLKEWHKGVHPSGENCVYLTSWGWSLQDGISTLRRGGDQSSFSLSAEDIAEWPSETRKMAFVRTWPSWHPALGLPASELWEINSCCLSHPIHESVL